MIPHPLGQKPSPPPPKGIPWRKRIWHSAWWWILGSFNLDLLLDGWWLGHEWVLTYWPLLSAVGFLFLLCMGATAMNLTLAVSGALRELEQEE